MRNGSHLREISDVEYLICVFVASITKGRHTEKAPSVARETKGTGEMFVPDSLKPTRLVWRQVYADLLFDSTEF
jgi:hypothetical protein